MEALESPDWAKAKPNLSTIRKVEEGIKALNERTGQVGFRIVEIEAECGVSSPSIHKVLVHLGWERTSRVGPWFPPKEKPAVEESEFPAIEAALRERPMPLLAAMMTKDELSGEERDEAFRRARVPVPREFIDSVDSWTLELGSLDGTALHEIRRVLDAAGLEMEVRVWRKTTS